MADEMPGGQGVRAIPLDDEAQVRRWAAILGGSPARRPGRRLSRYFGGAAKAVRAEGPAGQVGIGGRAGP
ncbi:hypothetical protein ACFODL_18105 [Phenylobacterium terrae]|uniref:Uncharacterized protein n=1 Tax=Phenylobacterium terrae TaxID=2665495 RepID=A0ABW4N3Z2_9CAUL